MEDVHQMASRPIDERVSFEAKANIIRQRRLKSAQRILMCAPDHFGVNYVINPWMENQIGQTDAALAREQWVNLQRLLALEGEIALVPPEPGLPDMVFTANGGMVVGNGVVVSRFRSDQRRSEERRFRLWFERAGFDVVDWPDEVHFEGAGDALLDRAQSLIWCGYGFRSSSEAPGLLEAIFNRRTVPLRLVDPRFYHLDTCLCPLADGWLMYYPPAFDTLSQEAIASYVEAKKRITVTEADALLFSCNAVELNGRVFMNGASAELQDKLRTAGFVPILTPLGEFFKAGGAAKCLTLKLVEK